MQIKAWLRTIIFGASLFLESGTRGQSDIVGEVRTEHGLHRATFAVPQGVIRVNVPDDLSVGDSISGTVYTEPDKGKSSKDLVKNTGEITGYVVEFPGQRNKTSERHFRWSVPTNVAGGVVPVLLRDPKGKVVSRGNFPVNLGPAGPAPIDIDLPLGAQAGSVTSAWGPFGGPAETSVAIGGKEADVIAESPRKLIFQTPADVVGPTTLQVRKGSLSSAGPFFTLGLQPSPIKQPLRSGETATMTARVSGLSGLQQPASLVIINREPGIITMTGGPVQQIFIQPAEVAADGSYTLTRTVTGVRDGRFDITLSVSRSPSSDLPLERLAGRAVDRWSATQNVPVSPDARSLVVSGVREAQPQLDRLLAPQVALRADPSTELDWLIRNYCFDLRDRKLAGGLARDRYAPRGQMARAFLPQGVYVSLDAQDIRRYSFTQFLGRLLTRLTPSDSLGELQVSSQPAHQPIAIDQVTGEDYITTHSFVLSVGKHAIRVGSCSQSITVTPNQQSTMRCPP